MLLFSLLAILAIPAILAISVHTPATYLMAVAMYCSEMHPCQTHSSPLEAAEAGTQTVGHSPQGCWPFRVAPPMPLSVSNHVAFN
jgi:hypothetical protein